MATYTDWLKALDVQLHNRKLRLTHNQFDGATLTDAYNTGVSPVQFALKVQQGTIAPALLPSQKATPILRPFAKPNLRFLGFVSDSFAGFAWFSWILAVGFFLVVAVLFIISILGKSSTSAAGALLLLCVQFGWSLALFAWGCISMLLSQGICLIVGIHQELTELNAKTPQP